MLSVSPLQGTGSVYIHVWELWKCLKAIVSFFRHGENMILTVADTLKPMNWRYNSIGHTELPIAIIDPLLNKIIYFPQGFLSDLLKKANRHYDDKKMNEYTQTIVSRHTQFTHRHTHTQTLFNLCFFLQLKMFDLNGDGKLGLSEMARWEGLCASWSEYVLIQYFIKCYFCLQTASCAGEFSAQVSGKIKQCS